MRQGIGILCAAIIATGCASAPPSAAPPTAQLTRHYTAISLEGFEDAIHHWRNRYGDKYAKYEPTQIVGIAENVLLYQRDVGGWIENQDATRILTSAEMDGIRKEKSNPKASFDNRNVYSQIEYLFAVYDQTGSARYRDAAMKGFDYTLGMQHKQCGGWPHTVPGSEAYHPYITMADEVTSGILRMLRKVENGSAPFASVPASDRARAKAARERGDACILKLQIVQNGQPTGWAGQYDPQTLQPAQGRTFELPSIISWESVEVVRYLMSIPSPSPEVVRAIDGAMSWFDRVKLTGVKIEIVPIDPPVKYTWHTATTDRRLVADPKAPPLWARFYDLKDSSVVLANRDGTRAATYADVHHERRTGYNWYGTWPTPLIETEYPAWKKRMGR
ncbi:MAG: pectate lyase [Moraxellaceae bacterium]|nr:pectate lyase [Moraxellaceae bacterium]